MTRRSLDWTWFGLGLGMLVPTLAFAQAPAISSLSPQAVKPGGATNVTLAGGNLAGVSQLWASFPCEAALASGIEANGTNAAQVVYSITVPADAPVGVHAIRVAGPGGVSTLKLCVVDDLPSVAQTPTNTAQSAAQVVTLPTAVDGAVAALTLNYYKFTATEGQKLSFEVLARRIGSPLDPIIRLLDANGRELAYCDDALGLSGDAQLSHKFAKAGDYLLEVRDIQYRGGGNFNYRLRIGDFPCVSVPYPLGAKRGSTATLAFAGLDVEGVEATTVQVPSEPLRNWINVGAKRTGGNASGFAVLAIGDNDDIAETEPNSTPEQSTRVPLGANLNGRFDHPGDRDRFVFTAKKGDSFRFAGVTRTVGSATDLMLQLFGPDGAKVAEAEDAGANEGAISYTFPADGDFTLAVQDLIDRGGSDFAYRIAVSPVRAGFTLSASADSINIPTGGTALITLNADRQGYDGPIEVAAVDLPAGVTSVPTVIGPGRKSVVLTVQSAADAAGAKVFPIRFVGTAKIGDAPFEATATLTDVNKAAFSAMPFPPLLIEQASALGLAPAPQFTLTAERADVVFGNKLTGTIKIKVNRTAGFDEEIALAITPEKDAVPAGITPALKPIPKGANEIDIAFAADDKAPLGEFTAVLIATHTKEKVAVSQPVPGLRLKLEAPLTVAADVGAAKVAKGNDLKIKVTVARNPALAGVATLTVENLPAGVTAAPVQLAADASEVEIPLAASQDAQVGLIDKLVIKAEVAVGDAKYSGSTAPLAVTVE